MFKWLSRMVSSCTWLCFAFAATVGFADTYPNKPVRLIVPFAAGGTTDLIARLVADRLGSSLGQSVIVDNRAGAGGTIGTEAVARAMPDGYTLGMGTVSTLNVNPIVYRSLGFNIERDLIPITCIAAVPLVLVVNSSVAAHSIDQLVLVSKSKPNTISYGSPGIGSLGHFLAEHFKQLTNASMVHVPYKGSSQLLNDLLGGRLDVAFDNLPSVLPHILSGKLRALAVAAPTKLDLLPKVPTFAEAGLLQLNDMSWFGLVAPVRTPEAVIERIHSDLRQALNRPDFVERLKQAGAIPMVNTPAEFAAQIRTGLERTRRVADSAAIRLE